MNLQRDIYKKLIEWKKSGIRKPLVLDGARQVGKTTVLRTFGEQEYKDCAYFDLQNNQSLNEIFNGYKNIDDLISQLSVYHNKTITIDTLIIIDEIQNSPAALNALKAFCQDDNRYHVAAAGSLLGLAIKDHNSWPVGKTDRVHIYPLSFMEFIMNINPNLYKLLITLQQNNIDQIRPFKSELINLYKQYLIVGGMPEVVLTWIKYKDISLVDHVLKSLLADYEQDFNKYHGRINHTKISEVFNNIPAQLAKASPKFVFSKIRSGARSDAYEQSVQWLKKTKLIYMINNVSTTKIPLKAYVILDVYKIYLFDVGLLRRLSEITSDIIYKYDELEMQYKGYLVENFVIQQLLLLSDSIITYFGENNQRNQIDFLMNLNNEIVPIEVKSKTSVKSVSLSGYRKKFKPRIAIRYSLLDYQNRDGLINIPLYLIGITNKLINHPRHNDKII